MKSNDSKDTQSQEFNMKWQADQKSHLKIRGSSLRPQRSVFKMRSLRPRTTAPEAAMNGKAQLDEGGFSSDE